MKDIYTGVLTISDVDAPLLMLTTSAPALNCDKVPKRKSVHKNKGTFDLTEIYLLYIVRAHAKSLLFLRYS